MKKTAKQLRELRQAQEEKRLFERKIEEDRLGISRKKQKRVMRFMTYRIIKLILLGTTGFALFFCTPALLPLTLLIAIMQLTTKRLQKEKNKNANKKYRIKIRATDSTIAIIMIVLTLGITGYSIVTAYLNGGSLSTSSSIAERFSQYGFSQAQINAAMSRASGQSAYEKILDDALSLMAGNRNIFKPRRMMFRSRPAGFEGMSDSTPMIRKRPNMLQMMRNMPLDMVFRQIFQLVCSVVVSLMVLVGIVNVIESFKYGEIKKLKLDKRFDAPTGANDPCPCGSGKKVKKCDCDKWWRYQ